MAMVPHPATPVCRASTADLNIIVQYMPEFSRRGVGWGGGEAAACNRSGATSKQQQKGCSEQ